MAFAFVLFGGIGRGCNTEKSRNGTKRQCMSDCVKNDRKMPFMFGTNFVAFILCTL